MKHALGLLALTLAIVSCAQNAKEKVPQDAVLVAEQPPSGPSQQDSILTLRNLLDDNLKGDRLAFGSTAIGSGPCESTDRAMVWLQIRNAVEENPVLGDSLHITRDNIQTALQTNLITAVRGYLAIEPNAPDSSDMLTRMCGEVALEQIDKFALLASEAEVDLSKEGFTKENIRRVAGKILRSDLQANGGALKRCWPCDLGLNNLVQRFGLSSEDVGISSSEFALLVR